MYDEILVIWACDSAGTNSLHRNVPDTKLKDSYLGHIIQGKNIWHVILRDDENRHGPFDSLGAARKYLESAGLKKVRG